MEALPTETRAEHIPQKKRVVVMLGARMYPGKEGFVFPLTLPESERLHESVVGRTSGGFARMRAVQEESKKSLQKGNMVTLVTGGQEKGLGSRADEAANALVSRYGLAPESVVSIGGKGSTIGNAAATAEYISAHHDELGDINAIEVVTNDYHMLRAWIMFSKGILELSGKKLAVSQGDKEKIQECLNADLRGEWNPDHLKETRNAVMSILEPYFAESQIKIVPVVAEDVLELAGEEGDNAKGKYADLLRNNAVIPEVVRSEYKGLMDLLEGQYEGKL